VSRKLASVNRKPGNGSSGTRADADARRLEAIRE
jgi:hypothetical protein